MKKLMIAALFALMATPALALGPEPYSVDVGSILEPSRWQASEPQQRCSGAGCPQERNCMGASGCPQRQQQQQPGWRQSSDECYGPNCPRPEAQKASGQPQQQLQQQRRSAPQRSQQQQRQQQGNH